MGSLGFSELLIIFLVVLLVFGAKRIPEIARGLGKGISEFRSATREITSELQADDHRPRIQSPRPPAQAPTPRNVEPAATPATPESDQT